MPDKELCLFVLRGDKTVNRMVLQAEVPEQAQSRVLGRVSGSAESAVLLTHAVMQKGEGH